MFRTLLQTPPDAVLLVLRLVRRPRLFGIDARLRTARHPGAIRFPGHSGRIGGALGLFVGLLGGVAAAGILVNMLVAVVAVHGKFGFFMHCTGKQAGEGYEFHLLAIAMALAIVIRGSGLWSLDRALSARATG